jgi:hypothetical protein
MSMPYALPQHQQSYAHRRSANPAATSAVQGAAAAATAHSRPLSLQHRLWPPPLSTVYSGAISFDCWCFLPLVGK